MCSIVDHAQQILAIRNDDNLMFLSAHAQQLHLIVFLALAVLCFLVFFARGAGTISVSVVSGIQTGTVIGVVAICGVGRP